jgi:hypothetical protein
MGGVGDQVGIPHGHIQGLVPHQSFYPVYVHPGQRQPACERMPLSVKDNPPLAVIFGQPFIKSYPVHASTIDKMRHKLNTTAGKAIYKLRKQVIEPVFGVIKSAIAIRQFQLRGIKKVNSEFKLIYMSYN